MQVQTGEATGWGMNKRRRAILDALQPAVAMAMESALSRDWTEANGLFMTARPGASAPGELSIYGRIGGGGWMMDGISAADVAAALKELGPGPLNVRINSGGGDVFDGVAIHSLLARHPGTVTVHVDGLAASAASFIMLAGDKVVTSRNAMVMVHDAMTFTAGGPASHRRALELLDKVSDNIADMYAEKAGDDVAAWREIMTVNGEDGTWYTGQEAYDAGLVDEIVGDGDDDDVDARLANWTSVLPQAVAERVTASIKTIDDEPVVEQEQHEEPVRLDRETLESIMKGVFA